MVPVVRTALVSMTLTGVMIITMWLWFDARVEVEQGRPISSSVQAARQGDSVSGGDAGGRLERASVQAAADASRFGSRASAGQPKGG